MQHEDFKMKIGTLEELGVEEGDTVRFHKTGYNLVDRYDKYIGKDAVIGMWGNVLRFSDGTGGFSAQNEHVWELISRVADGNVSWQSVPDTDKEYRSINGKVEFRDKQQWQTESRWYGRTDILLGNTGTTIYVNGGPYAEELAHKICEFLQEEHDG